MTIDDHLQVSNVSRMSSPVYNIIYRILYIIFIMQSPCFNTCPLFFMSSQFDTILNSWHFGEDFSLNSDLGWCEIGWARNRSLADSLSQAIDRMWFECACLQLAKFWVILPIYKFSIVFPEFSHPTSLKIHLALRTFFCQAKRPWHKSSCCRERVKHICGWVPSCPRVTGSWVPKCSMM